MDVRSLIEQAARLAGQHAARERLDEVAAALQGAAQDASALDLWQRAWRAAGLEGEARVLPQPAPSDLPFAAREQASGRWLLVRNRAADGNWQALAYEGSAGRGVETALADLTGLECIALPRRKAAAEANAAAGNAQPKPRAFKLVTSALWRARRVFGEALVASVVANLLALGVSLFSMQVFDRVIPNQGYQTLWVLTVGVVMAVLIETMLKLVRSHMLERTAGAVDMALSRRFFERMLGIRLEARPNSVGTLAAQVKGFEMVRGVLASASLFVLTDVPFALFFIGVIAIVGGPVALIPLALAPLSLGIGFALQALVRKSTREQQGVSNRKAGLLVESADGAESLKSMGGEWALQGRWNALVDEAARHDQHVRSHGNLSQTLIAGLQQLGYVSVIAFGALRVSDNLMTMGALLACSILSNRALGPIVQLPGVMLQWAHARAALEGLDQLLALPNEEDEKPDAIVPGALAPALRFERVRFVYTDGGPPAFEADRLEIRPGERVGLLGPVGSGKSTLLKLASTLHRPQQGQVFLSGLNASQLHPGVVRETVAYLPQESRLFSGTLRDNIVLGLPDPGDEAILKAAVRTGLHRLIASQPKGLALPITEGGRGISGGQKQQVVLTRLLLAMPSLWLLDEPTGAMDADNEAQVVRLLKDVLNEKRTALIATHKTALLPLLTRLIVVRGGRIVMDGPVNEVMAKLRGGPPGGPVQGAPGAPGAAAGQAPHINKEAG